MRATRRAFVSLFSAFGLLSGKGRAQTDSEEKASEETIAYGQSGYGVGVYGGSISKCFIATAAAGAGSEEVAILRQFRDEILEPSRVGRGVIWLYYRLSPPVARWISRRAFRKSTVRTYLVRPAAELIRPVIAR